MIYDRKITISVGSSRKSVDWRPQTLLISELYERLRTPARSTETMAEYMGMQKGQQDELKDIGGFVGGSLNGSRRKAGAVTGRDMLALDLDNIPNGMTENVCARVEALGCGYCIYSTRKHRPDAPRLRILCPLDRTCAADEYEPVARYAMNKIGLELADPTTFEAQRLMYWPSVCADGQYVFYSADKPMLSVDGVLAAYADWRDTASWPRLPGEVNHRRLAAKQGDPTEKKGIVGAFCRVYDVPSAMAKFLPGVYAGTATEGRYTYTGGSTTGGAILYDDGKFLYSHHATDPCSNRLVNAFDLVRLHKFGDLDDNATEGTPTVKMPSFTEMCKLAATDDTVAGLILREKRESMKSAFSPVAMESTASDKQTADDLGWEMQLQRHERTGLPLPTIDNIWIILEHDPNLKGRFALNEFAGRGEVLEQLPWSKCTERRFWDDNDIAGINWYMEKLYQIKGVDKIDKALSLHSNHHSFNEVADYLNSLEWDDIPRLDTLFIDYLGAEDTEYVRTVTRKAFTAAVTRALRPGTKFDEMTVLSGPQGIGKSTLLDKMSKGWFNDSIRTFRGKEASELLQGSWIVELGELDGLFQDRDASESRVKQFLSQRIDKFRAAYGKSVQDYPRRCVFFGTTNRYDYLRDKTGNRRFWPVDVGVKPHTKNVWDDLDAEIDQLWAEAVFRWKYGEALYLPKGLWDEALKQQEAHREVNAHEGMILEFLEKPVPIEWQTMSLDRRLDFLNGNLSYSGELALRDRICAAEIWCELFHGFKKDLKQSDTREINSIIESAPNWKSRRLKFGYCGLQRGYVRVKVSDNE